MAIIKQLLNSAQIRQLAMAMVAYNTQREFIDSKLLASSTCRDPWTLNFDGATAIIYTESGSRYVDIRSNGRIETFNIAEVIFSADSAAIADQMIDLAIND